MDELDHLVEDVFANTTAPGTKSIYLNSIARFVQWLWEYGECRHLFVEAFKEAVGDGVSIDDAMIRSWLRQTPFISPIHLDQLTHLDFCRFVVAQKRSDGGLYSKSVFGTFRSALMFLFTMGGRHIGTDFAARLTVFYKGIKTKLTTARQTRNAKLTDGKEPFSFSLYRAISTELLRSSSKDAIFSRFFLVLSWNLMCRAANTESIRHAHVYWEEDSLAIKFSHMKNDQEGDRPGDGRHIYANPVIPAICPVLGLGIYFAVLGFASDDKLFPGKSQYDRYTKALKRALAVDEINRLLTWSGLNPSDFGSHSARKGSATYVSSCSTSGPSASAICLRAGWSLPGVQNTYIRFEGAGDMVVGRFVSGLPFETPEFALLPPHFPAPTALLDRAITICFPAAPTSMRRVCEFCLASLVYHEPYLVQTLPASHLLFQTPLFRHPQLVAELRLLVRCQRYEVTDPIRPTGIPAHIGIMVSLSKMEAAYHAGNERTVAQVKECMQEHNQPFTNEGHVRSVLEAVLDSRGIHAPIQTAPTPDLPPPSDAEPQYPIHTWGGRLSRMPDQFDFPKGSLATAWQYWCVGDPVNKFPPFRQLTSHDMAARNNKKRLSDFRLVMKMVEDCLSEHRVNYSTMTAEQAARLFRIARPTLPIGTRARGGDRDEQLEWVSLVRYAPRKKRRQRRQPTRSP